MKPQSRNLFDLSHFSMQLGEIGRLQTVTKIPTLPGDSINLEIAGVVKMSPLRRDLILDALVEFYAFWVPYRHIYGEDWLDFIRQGNDESVSFDSVDNDDMAPYLACNHRGDLPLWITAGYNRIYNRYFRPPTDDSKILSDTYIANDDRTRDFGVRCGFKPRLWSATIDRELGTSDETVGVSSNRLNLMDLEQAKKHLRTELEREWFAQRYRDVMDNTWGTTVNIDADERPDFLYRSGFWLSGVDVNGTSGDSLGQFAGKSMALGGMRMPSRFFNEHGTLWVMALTRFPTIFNDEKHYLEGKANPSYRDLAGDPTIMSAQPPMRIDTDDFFGYGGDSNVGTRPFGDWYREHPSYCHVRFDNLDGFPFYDDKNKTKNELREIDSSKYENVFQTTQQGHYRLQLRCNAKAKRYVPDSRTSIFVGAKS